MAKVRIFFETRKKALTFLTKPRGKSTGFLIKPRGKTTYFLTKPRGMRTKNADVLYKKRSGTDGIKDKGERTKYIVNLERIGKLKVKMLMSSKLLTSNF